MQKVSCFHKNVEEHLAAPPEEVKTTMIAALTLIAARTFKSTDNLLSQRLFGKKWNCEKHENFFILLMKQQTQRVTSVLRDT